MLVAWWAEVLESHSACVQILEGLSCNRRAEVLGSMAEVLEPQEAAEAARAVTWRECAALDPVELHGSPVCCDAHRLRLGARVVLDVSHSVRHPAAAGSLRSIGPGPR